MTAATNHIDASIPSRRAPLAAGTLPQLGGHHAAGLMATHRGPIETATAILFTVGTIDDACKLAALALLGVALLAFAGAAVGGAAGSRTVPRAWCGSSLLLGAVLLGLSGADAAPDGNLTDPLLVTGGALLLPAWLVWTGRLLRSDDRSRHAS